MSKSKKAVTLIFLAALMTLMVFLLVKCGNAAIDITTESEAQTETEIDLTELETGPGEHTLNTDTKNYTLDLVYYMTGVKEIDKEVSELLNEHIADVISPENNSKMELTAGYKHTVCGSAGFLTVFLSVTDKGNTEKEKYVYAYDRTSGKMMALREFFSEPGSAASTVAELTYNKLSIYLTEKGIAFGEDILRKDIGTDEDSFILFYFNSEGLNIIIPEGRLSCAPNKEITVTVLYAELAGKLKPGYFPGYENYETETGETATEPGSETTDNVTTETETTETTDTADTTATESSETETIPPESETETDTGVSTTRDYMNFIDDKLIALSFDDGPSKYTKILLDGLLNTDARVTFFVVGSRAGDYAATLLREYNEGHLVGSHSYSHKKLTTMTTEEAIADLKKGANAVKAVTGEYPAYVRMPYGVSTQEIRNGCGMTVVGWNVDFRDWETRDRTYVYNQIIASASDGAIMDMHDVYESSVLGALDAIDYLSDKGYAFVTVEEMYLLQAARKN